MPEELTRPSPHFKRYTAFGAPISLVGSESIASGVPCRMMRFETGGTVTLKRASDGGSQTLPVVDTERLEIQATEITSVVGVTGITVFW